MLTRVTTLSCSIPAATSNYKSIHQAEWPSNLIDIIKLVLKAPLPAIEESKFKFDISIEAAQHNWNELQKYDTLGAALKAEGNSPLKYGSEFQPTRLLQYIFQYHPLWDRLKENLDNGVDYPLEEVPNNVRKKDLKGSS